MTPQPSGSKLTRRRLLQAAPAGVGAAGAIAADRAAWPAGASGSGVLPDSNGRSTIEFHGAHQAGIEVEPPAFQSLVALRFRAGTTRDDIARLLRILTDDAARMTRGVNALADAEPEFAALPANLTVTFGFGPELVRIVRGDDAVPAWLGPLPAYGIDALDSSWSGGDLLLQIATDDAVTLSHTTRMLLKDARSFARVVWHQRGFRRAHGSQPSGTTMRNLLGQLDGTVNVRPGSPEFAAVVWRRDGPEWLVGGTTMVVRRIKMLLDKWDRLDRPGREASVGRRLSDGAPLTGGGEHDAPDYGAVTPIGFPVIAEFAHIRRARPVDPVEQIFRRGYNYDEGPDGVEVTDGGLIFTSFQADLTAQYLPIQQRLADLDLLNEWTTPIGSAVFAVPPGAERGSFVGEVLF